MRITLALKFLSPVEVRCFWPVTDVLLYIIIIIITIELSLDGSSPYTNTDKTNKNEYT